MSDRIFTPAEKFNTMSVEPVNGGTTGPGKGLDANRYATKKTIAQGMLDIALLTANASQLKYVLTVGEKHEFYTLMLVLISISLVLQLMVGLLSLSLSLMRDCRLHKEEYRISALVINNINTVSVFFIAVLNILISGFGIYPSGISAINTNFY